MRLEDYKIFVELAEEIRRRNLIVDATCDRCGKIFTNQKDLENIIAHYCMCSNAGVPEFMRDKI